MARITFEIELEVTGDIMSAEPDVGFAERYVEDIEIEGMTAEKFVARLGEKGPHYQTINLLAGVDQKSPAWLAFISNILPLIHSDAEDAILSEQG
jgi:hypothetical protein